MCKYYPDDDIFKPENRFEREVNALELYEGSIAPILIWKKKSRIIVYEYLIGNELLKVSVDESIKHKIKHTISRTHEIARTKRKPIKEDVTKYYENLILNYSTSKVNFPEKQISDLQQLIDKQKEYLDRFSENLTYVHGDLVPPNLIVNDQIKFIDWEFFRPELSFFDYQYFNYYAEAHGMAATLDIEEEVSEFYNQLIDVLERLWRFGYLKESKEIFYKID